MMPDISLDDPFVQDVFTYLDTLRSSGVTNMYGAGIYLEDRFGVDKNTSHSLLSKWMETFTERHPA